MEDLVASLGTTSDVQSELVKTALSLVHLDAARLEPEHLDATGVLLPVANTREGIKTCELGDLTATIGDRW